MKLEQALYAIFEIGGLTAFGRFIDFLLSTTERKKLRDILETWWYRLADARWRTLGRNEAVAALRIWDQVVGECLLSLKRLIASIVVVLISALLSGRFVSWFSLQTNERVYTIDWSLAHDDSGTPDSHFRAVIFPNETLELALLIPIVAVSFSLTRLLSRLVLRVPDRFASVSFFVLLGMHIALFLVWRPVVVHLFQNIQWWANTHWWQASYQVNGGIWTFITSIRQLPSYLFPLRLEDATYGTPEFLADLLCNGVRLGFSAIFVTSLLLRDIIQRPISRLWARIVESDKPIFTMVFGAASTAFAIGHALLNVIH